MVTEFLIVLVTAKKTEAKKIQKELVAKKLSACVNVIPDVSSCFSWKGKTENAKESLLIIKTREPLLDKLIATVKKLHSYDVPEIIALPVVGGYDKYMKWLKESTE